MTTKKQSTELREALEDLAGASQLCLDWFNDMTAGQFDARYGAHYDRASVLANVRKCIERARSATESVMATAASQVQSPAPQEPL